MRNLLKKLGSRVLYMDTDSAFYVSRKDREEFEPKSGNYLGELTNVLEDVEGYVVLFEDFVVVVRRITDMMYFGKKKRKD